MAKFAEFFEIEFNKIYLIGSNVFTKPLNRVGKLLHEALQSTIWKVTYLDIQPINAEVVISKHLVIF